MFYCDQNLNILPLGSEVYTAAACPSPVICPSLVFCPSPVHQRINYALINYIVLLLSIVLPMFMLLLSMRALKLFARGLEQSIWDVIVMLCMMMYKDGAGWDAAVA